MNLVTQDNKNDILQFTGKVAPQMNADPWGKCLTLHPGLQLRCMELNESRNVAIDFQRDCPFLEFGCLLSGRISGRALLENGQKQYIEGRPGQTWCSFCTQARGTMEYLSGQTICVVLFLICGSLLKDLPLFRQGGQALTANGRSFSTCGNLTPAVSKIVQQIMQINERADASNQLLLISKAYELLFLLSIDESPDDTQSRERRQGVERAQDILNRNLASPPSLTNLARQSGLCVTSLTEAFKKQAGTTVFGYLRQQRLARAKELITLHRMSASEAAWEVGYSSLSSFHRAFCSRYGATPGSFCRRP
jgi:AraC-like DNA-binding protein